MADPRGHLFAIANDGKELAALFNAFVMIETPFVYLPYVQRLGAFAASSLWCWRCMVLATSCGVMALEPPPSVSYVKEDII
ncbi:hypothetical protein COLO4_37045 [Corchorus olitorius]|uniref:Uncharacterized protein n=1 Tax=Corchorus olitorius TaxID=93759 RepID=A0A1R3G3Q1_9ROSI|nr:hypothetical protein COLO4_37045 [Corchorus olitorius]